MFFDFEIFYDGEDEQTIKQNKIYRPRKYFEEENFRERFRLDREQFEDFLSQISASLKPINSTNHAMSAKDKLLTALRFYATGSIYAVIGDSHGPSKSSVCRSIRQVTRAINLYMFQRNVGYPDNFANTTTGFYEKGKIPSIFGCIDGTLIKILAPSKYEEQFVDRKNEHSINVMLVCGPTLKFYDASVRWPGSTHDSRVFKNSRLFERLSSGWRPFHGAFLLGDSGYPLRQIPIEETQDDLEGREKGLEKLNQIVAIFN